jgi:hypothetical protein
VARQRLRRIQSFVTTARCALSPRSPSLSDNLLRRRNLKRFYGSGDLHFITRFYALGEAGPVAVNAWQVLKMKIRPPVA